ALESSDAALVLLDAQHSSLADDVSLLESFHAGVEADADVVDLRKDCSGRRNCFEDMDALLAWIVGTRPPREDEPLLVRVGAGRFGKVVCDTEHHFDHVSFHGAGREHTTIGEPGDAHGLHAQDCEDLDFEDLAVFGTSNSVYWIGGGSST